METDFRRLIRTLSHIKPHSVTLNLQDYECLCLGIEWLIKVKRAAGRPKDFEAIAELEAILEERRRLES